METVEQFGKSFEYQLVLYKSEQVFVYLLKDINNVFETMSSGVTKNINCEKTIHHNELQNDGIILFFDNSIFWGYFECHPINNCM